MVTKIQKCVAPFHRIVCTIIFGAFVVSAYSLDFAVGAENPPGLTFLRLEIDARGSALGGAMTATGTGLNALQWNPAGLVSGMTHEVVFSHMRGFDDIDSEYFGLLLKMGTKRAFAISVFSNNIGGIEQRTRPTLSPSGIISAHDFYTGITYSQVVNERFQVGITAKYLYQKIFFNSATGYAGDIGVRYVPKEKGLVFGIALHNFGSMNAFIQEKPTLPTIIRVGTAYTLPFLPKSDHGVTLSGEYELLFEGINSTRFGIEYRYSNKYCLRAGYVTGFEERDLSLGAGIYIRRFGLDYALLPDVTSFGNQHIFSLRLKI